MQTPCKLLLPVLVLLTFSVNTTLCQDRSGPQTDLELAVITGVAPNRKYAEAYYNQTGTDLTESEGLESAPGCPVPIQGHPWVYFGDPPKCHLSGYQYPCPANMKLFAQKGSSYGYCDCDCNIFRGDRVNSPQAYCYSETKQGNPRTLVYKKEWDSCHSLFDQAECPEGQWLIFGDDPKLGPYCDQRMCPESVDKYRFYFYDYQQLICHRLRDKCETSHTSSHANRRRVSYRYQVSLTDWVPRCDVDELANSPGGNRNTAGSILRFSCAEGEKFSSILERCIPIRGSLTYSGIG